MFHLRVALARGLAPTGGGVGVRVSIAAAHLLLPGSLGEGVLHAKAIVAYSRIAPGTDRAASWWRDWLQEAREPGRSETL